MNLLGEQKKIRTENLGTWCMSEDKLTAMRLLGCDEKYNQGRASDFELFEEWNEILPLCVGTGSAKLYEEQLALLGIKREMEARVLWQKGNVILCAEKIKEIKKENERIVEKQGFDIVQYVIEFTKNKENVFCGFGEMVARISSLISSGRPILFDAKSFVYIRPDRYHATLLWEAINRGEKIKEENFFLLCFQLLIEVLLLHKKENSPSTVTLLTEDSSMRESFVCYLRDHSLMQGVLRVSVFLNEPCDAWYELCQTSGKELLIAPILFMRPRDFGVSLEESLRAFLSVYPIGGVRFGGLLSDSFSLALAARSLLARTLDRLLLQEESCDENRQKILKNILKN